MKTYFVEIIGDDEIVEETVGRLIGGVLNVDGVLSVNVIKNDLANTVSPATLKKNGRKKNGNTELSVEDRRKEVLHLLNDGLTNTEIADKLNLTRSTVYNDRATLRVQGYDI